MLVYLAILVILFIVLVVFLVWVVRDDLPFCSAIIGLVAGAVFVFTIAIGIDSFSEEEYNYAVIKMPDGTVVEGELNYYFDLNDVVELTIDGVQYKVSQENCALISKDRI